MSPFAAKRLETGGTDIMYDRQRLIELFRQHALKFGDFTLASGRKSRASEIGCEVVCAVGVCDRLQGGAEAFAARGIPFRSLLTIRDFGIEATGST